LEVRQLSYRVHRDWILLDQVSFSLGSGEVLGIYGENGCGKTTLLHILAGLLKPQAGDVVMNTNGREAENISRWPLWKRARHGIAYLPQENRIWTEMTVADHLRSGILGGQQNTNPELGNLVEDLPKDMPASILSQGQQRRLLLSRYLLMNPRILLADEPLAGLDAASQSVMTTALTRLTRQGMAAILVEHDQSVLRDICSRTMVLEGGRLHVV